MSILPFIFIIAFYFFVNFTYSFLIRIFFFLSGKTQPYYSCLSFNFFLPIIPRPHSKLPDEFRSNKCINSDNQLPAEMSHPSPRRNDRVPITADYSVTSQQGRELGVGGEELLSFLGFKHKLVLLALWLKNVAGDIKPWISNTKRYFLTAI